MEHINFAQDSTLSTKKRVRRVALACIPCRSRKVCNRCQYDEKVCEYQKSRRGGRPRKQPPSNCSVERVENETSISHRRTSPTSSTEGTGDAQELASQPSMIPSIGSYLAESHVEQLLAQFYTYFHAAHPCVLPRWSLEARMGTDSALSEHLLPVLLYIGSIFMHSIDSEPLADAALQAIEYGRSYSGIPNPYHVQAILLYSITVYWCNAPQIGRMYLDEAIEAAFLLGMHRKEFASQYGYGDSVLEESWRRTWWQIHVTDVHISGSTHTYEGLSTKFPITTELPCEELNYERGEIPQPLTLKQYENREFCDIEFSSFAQLIGFSQGITKVLAFARLDDLVGVQALCVSADTMMTAWFSLLPPSKKSLLGDDGKVDEILFKAMIVMQTCIVDLHRRLSSLLYSPVESASLCAPPPPTANDIIKEEARMHTAKILCATEKLNTLLTLPTRFATHTPFIICMIANMTIAHLSACRYIFTEPRLSVEREKIRLNMGVLKMLGEFWPAGKREYKAVGTIAKAILDLKDEDAKVPESGLSFDVMDFGFGDGANLDFSWCDELGAVDARFFDDTATLSF
ncbi:unnamed protein product [Periconia digitata]|uniref:Xylanolytic transcriptional activator regulatory domain-containing protein n=1 Tax=Periconia digitata TaxID=1303443 RepID=A0A9W4UH71_9PLEO|nr:unnamed protein product [Periconia digitata]